MAKTSNRKINIYINGKQVENNVKSIRGAMRKLQNEQAKMTIGSKQYIKATEKIKDLNKVLDKHYTAIGRTARGWKKLAGEIKTIAFGNIIANLTTAIPQKLFQSVQDITNEFANFEKGFVNVQTLMSDSDISQFSEEMKTGALDISEYGIAIDDVNKALFDTISAGVDAGDSIAFMDESAQLAIGGVTDLSIATDGMTTVMNAFGLEVSEAGDVADAFFTAQKFGKTTVDELATGVGKTAPIFQAAGGTYRELLAATAELTKGGIATRESFTYLKALMSNLVKPAKESEAALRKLGIPFGITDLKAKGFSETLRLVSKAVEEHPDLIGKALPSMEAQTAALSLSNEKFEDYQLILQSVQTDIGENSSLTKAYNMQAETMAQVMSSLSAKTKRLAIELGDKLAPYIQNIITLIGGWSKKLLKLIDWLVKHAKQIKFLAKLVVILTTSIVSYNLAQKLAVMWTKRATVAQIYQNTVDKISIILKKAQKAITILFAGAQALLTRNIKRATAAMRLFNMVTKMSPVGLVVGILTAAAAAFIIYKKTMQDAVVVQTNLEKATIKATKAHQQEIDTTELLFEQLKNTNAGTKERAYFLDKVNKKYNLHLKNLKNEKEFLEQIESAYQKVINKIKSKIALEANKEVLTKLIKEEAGLRITVDLNELKLKRLEGLDNVMAEAKTKEMLELSKKTLEDNILLQHRLAKNVAKTTVDLEDFGSVTDNNTTAINNNNAALTKRNSLYDELIKIYNKYQTLLQKEIDKTKYMGMDKDTREIEMTKDKWNERINIATESMNKLEALGSERTEDETALMQNLHYQIIALEDSKYMELMELEMTFQENKRVEKSKAQKKIEKVLMNDQQREILAVKEKYENLIKLAKDNGLETIELYEKMMQEITAIKDKDTNKEDETDILGMTAIQWDALKAQFNKIMKYTSLVRDAYGSYSEYRKKQEEEQLNLIQKNSERKLAIFESQKNREQISEATYQSKVAELERQTAEKKRAIQIEQAEREKKMRIFDSIINTASAAVQALPNFALSAAIAVAGATQTAFIQATPIPAYAKGSRINEPHVALVGEAGPEIIFGNKMLRNPQTGPALNYLADIQEGKSPSMPGLNAPNFAGMKNASSYNQSNQNIINNTIIDNSELSAKFDNVVSQNKKLNENFNKLYKLMSDKNYRIKAEINNDEFKEIQRQNEFIDDFTKF